MATYEWENCPYCGKQVSDVRIGAASDTTIGDGLGECHTLRRCIQNRQN